MTGSPSWVTSLPSVYVARRSMVISDTAQNMDHMSEHMYMQVTPDAMDLFNFPVGVKSEH